MSTSHTSNRHGTQQHHRLGRGRCVVDGLPAPVPRRREGSHENGEWALPGTFLHPGERLTDAVLRSLRDKAGVEGLHPRQLHVFDDPDRDGRGWVLSVAHLDVLPFDHDAIVSLAVRELRDSCRLIPDPDRLLSSPFTLLQLRLLHQAVLGRPLLKDTFRRRMQPQLRATGRHLDGEVGKPALLFRRAH